MAAAQNYANHHRFNPGFHFILVPILLANVVITLITLIRTWPHHAFLHAWVFVIALALLLLAGVSRASTNVVQDRVIRLEESLRYQRLLTPQQLADAQTLTVRQIIALRFASDAELPALLDRAAAEKLDPKTIKQAITTWRADHLRA